MGGDREREKKREREEGGGRWRVEEDGGERRKEGRLEGEEKERASKHEGCV